MGRPFLQAGMFCCGCGKPHTEAGRKDKYCRLCRKMYTRWWRERPGNREKTRKYNRKYNAEHPEVLQRSYDRLKAKQEARRLEVMSRIEAKAA